MAQAATIQQQPRRFALVRTRDVSGVSGTGIVAYGVEFADGTVAVRWLGRVRSTGVHDSVANLLVIHGHEGDTTVRWLDSAEGAE